MESAREGCGRAEGGGGEAGRGAARSGVVGSREPGFRSSARRTLRMRGQTPFGAEEQAGARGGLLPRYLALVVAGPYWGGRVRLFLFVMRGGFCSKPAVLERGRLANAAADAAPRRRRPASAVGGDPPLSVSLAAPAPRTLFPATANPVRMILLLICHLTRPEIGQGGRNL